MAYKRMRRVSAASEQAASLVFAAIMLVWLVTRPSIHWPSWVLASIVVPLGACFAWPRKSRRRCEGCGAIVRTSGPL